MRGKLLLLEGFLSTEKLLPERIEHALDLGLLRSQKLFMDLVQDFSLIGRHQIVLDLQKNVRGCFNDLVFKLEKLCVTLLSHDVNQSLLLCYFFLHVIN